MSNHQMKSYNESIFRLSTILVTANSMNINTSLNVNYFVREPSRPAAVCLSLEEQEISQQSRVQEHGQWHFVAAKGG